MNIFVLDTDPKLAARAHCDKHVVKMVLESAQLLSTAHHIAGSTIDLGSIYKPTHIEHPCAKWCRENAANYKWLYNLYHELAREYTHRYCKIHKAATITPFLQSVPDGVLRRNPTSSSSLTPFVQCMPDEYKHEDAVTAYRDYYVGEKASFAKWTNREPPYWWPHNTEEN